VADLAAAEHFYIDLLGLDLMQRFGGQAAFISAGGYHHHVGLNTWAGIGAPPPPATAARLLEYELVVPDGDALYAMVARLRQAGVAIAQEGNGWAVADPSANRLVLRGEKLPSA
jgi:catechol 2,3-dioxygenase